MDEQRRVLADAAIVIEQDRIVAVESAQELRDQFTNAEPPQIRRPRLQELACLLS